MCGGPFSDGLRPVHYRLDGANLVVRQHGGMWRMPQFTRDLGGPVRSVEHGTTLLNRIPRLCLEQRRKVQLVIDNELAAYVRRAIRCPIEVSPETLAVEVVHQVGPGGSFLNEAHTAKHFRDELHLSPLFQAQAWDTVQQRRAAFDTATRATQIARVLWHPADEPVLTDDQLRAIDAVVRSSQL